MSVKTKIYFCLSCNNGGLTKEKITHDGCQQPHYIVQADVIFNMIHRTRWGRFLSWLYARDIGLGLAIIGMVGLNGMLMQHFQLSIGWSVVEGLCFGLAIPRLLK
jgi:hypothetical protein